MEAFAILGEATMKAAVHIAHQQGLNKADDYAGKLAEALKTVMKANIAKVQREWAEALDANLGNAWLKKLMETQAVEMAQEAVKLI